MSLPQAVIEQEREAEELHKKLYSQPEETPVEEPKGQEGVEPEPKEEPKAEGEPKNEPEPVQPAPVASAPEVDVAEYERLKAAHSTLLGKYNKEVPRQADTIRALEAKVAALEVQLTATPKTEAPKPQADEDLSGVYAQMESDFGKDFAANFRKAAQAEARKIMAEGIQGVKGEVENIGKTVATSREERFLAELTRLNPTWRTSFNDARFAEMLAEVEPFTGKTLGTLAQEANDAYDAVRVARVYEMFDKRVAPPAKKVETTPIPPKDKPNKETLIAPAAGGKSTTPEAKPAEYVKAEDIERFYQEVALGKWNDRPKEMKETEARINHAISNRLVLVG